MKVGTQQCNNNDDNDNYDDQTIYAQERGVGGWGNSHKKRMGPSLEILKRTPKGTEAWLKFSSPLRSTQIVQPHYVPSNYVQINTVKGTAKALTVDLLRLNNLRHNKTVF